MKTRRRRGDFLAQDEQDQEYWLSYSDLMAGLLMVFTLMLFSALSHYQRKVVEVHDLLAVREEIATSLRETFGKSPALNVEVDSITGVIRFKDQVLFDQGSSVLRPEGRAQLAAFADSYFNVLLGKEKYVNQLEEIVVEGHTNDDGSYMYNLELSQERAYAVMEFLLAETRPNATKLKQYVTANGRSFSKVVKSQTGEVDKERSRRIEIRFRLKDEEVIRDIMQRLNAG